MRDTKSLELEALNLISHKLQSYGFAYATLSFDENGIDGLIFDEDHDLHKILKLQSKGRSIINGNSSVDIPKRYVDDAFICFVYIKTNNPDDQHIYMFTSDEIKTWKDNGHEYILYVSQKYITDHSNDQYRLTKERATVISQMFANQETSYDVKIIDLDLLELTNHLWVRYNSLIDAKLLAHIDHNSNTFVYSTPIGILLMCLFVIYEDKGEFYGIDWGMQYLKEMESEVWFDEDSLCVQDKYVSDWAITYHNTYVAAVSYHKGGSSINGFHLHIGDSEEQADAYLFRNGECYVKVNGDNMSAG